MWIEPTSNGKYKYVERYEDYRSGKLKRVSVTFDNKTRETQKKAKLILEEKIAKKLNEQKLTIVDMNLFTALDEWLSVYEKQVEDTTYSIAKQFKVKVNNYFSSDALVTRISITDWNNFLHDLAYVKNLSNGTVDTYKRKTSVFLAYCIQKGYIDEINTSKIAFQRKKEDDDNIEEKFLEDDEYEKVIAAFNDNKRYKSLFQWQYYTGMRIGEVLALRKSDVHITPNRAYVSVTGTYSHLNNKRKERTKTKAGTREVDLPPKAVEIYHQACELSDVNFLFVNKNQKTHKMSNLGKALTIREERIKLNKHLTTHIFRHTHVSKLAELGVPLNVIKDRVGHESSDITERIYLHVTKNMKREMVEKLDLL
ncbi:tyrosine-type recombinase/integrase [Enterococcus cecorum]|uniref:tyrosine-type recombinase/integrase n=1 Tax=Enterococcus cecorum TaxID=44008 RepID=UPI00148BD37A|nr:site-specific integrase [Enterococcus cecorum]